MCCHCTGIRLDEIEYTFSSKLFCQCHWLTARYNGPMRSSLTEGLVLVRTVRVIGNPDDPLVGRPIVVITCNPVFGNIVLDRSSRWSRYSDGVLVCIRSADRYCANKSIAKSVRHIVVTVQSDDIHSQRWSRSLFPFSPFWVVSWLLMNFNINQLNINFLQSKFLSYNN